jgi:ATP-dependent helicase/DNAse subunit B
MILTLIKKETFNKGDMWLAKLLEVGEGNHIGYIVLSKQEFEEELTGYKKLFSSWDDKQEIDEKMTPD